MSTGKKWVYFVAYSYLYYSEPRFGNAVVSTSMPINALKQVEQLEEELLGTVPPGSQKFVDKICIVSFQLLREEATQ